jgi:hypothetical protein
VLKAGRGRSLLREPTAQKSMIADGETMKYFASDKTQIVAAR